MLPLALLRRYLTALLGDGEPLLVEQLTTRLQWLEIEGGQTLMTQGDAGDSMYLVVSGRLRAYASDGDAPLQAVGDISRGEVVGELSLYTDAPRSATVVAVRDSVLVRLARVDFDALVARHPALGRALTRQIIKRQRAAAPRAAVQRPATMALLPISDGVDLHDFGQRLAAALRAHGRVAVVGASRIASDLGHCDASAGDALERRIAIRLDQIEAEHDFVLLLGDTAPGTWTRRCCRHADEILLLADASQPPRVHATERECLAQRPPLGRSDEVLVLLHAAACRSPRGTRAWLARRPVTDHVHVRPELARDMARLARLQSRNGVGLVLAGGGARGFAHLGVYRALRERGIEVDCVGGTSIGAVMATYVASDQPPEVVDANARRAFAANPTGDVDWLPLLSLFKGRRLRATLASAIEDLLGYDADVEDLWKAHYSVATNYTQAREQVLRSGNLVQALLASASIPGVLPPVVRDGDLLCDGGTFNNFPVDVMLGQRGIGRVIGVDLDRAQPDRVDAGALPGRWALLRDRLRPRHLRRLRLPWLPSYLRRLTILYSTSRQRQAQTLTDLCFNPRLGRVGLMDWRRIDRIAEQGYRDACRRLATLDAQTAAWLLRPAAAPADDGGRQTDSVLQSSLSESISS